MDRGGRILTLLATVVAVAVAVISSVAVAAAAALDVKTLAFHEGFTHLFGEGNLVRSGDGRNVRLLLDRSSGSGFMSSDKYHHGFFSASIKLPSDYTAGIVVAFYMSNMDVFEKTHDEIDFEFLGNIRGREWRIQTNVYGNGSTSRGREERYFLPFDPSKQFHRYSILWTAEKIIFYIDGTPIREVRRSDAMGGDYPSKPMSLYATIWDGSSWATSGGRYKVMYKYAPFVSEFSDLALLGCRRSKRLQHHVASSAMTNNCTTALAELQATGLHVMTPERRRAMRAFREQYMSYSYCYDQLRYSVALPECHIVESESKRFRETGHLRSGSRHRRVRRRTSVPEGGAGSKSQLGI